MKKTGHRILFAILFIFFAAGVLVFMNYLFDQSETVRDVFSGSGREQVLGKVAPGSDASLAARQNAFGRASMMIFSLILLVQLVAFGAACLVTAGIRAAREPVKIRLKQLENADIFFDIPLYVGLFGTITGFLLMVFSPQSSLLIAYSSTLFGIFLSLVLRLTVLYPFRRRLLSGNECVGGDEK